MMPAMMSAKATPPNTSGSSDRPDVRIQPTFSDTAAATSTTQSTMNTAVAVWRRVMDGRGSGPGARDSGSRDEARST